MLNDRIFYKILSVPQNTAMGLNNVMAKLWNAIMKQKLCLFTIHQTATSLQWTNNLNPRTKWYPALDESNRTRSVYFTIHPGKFPPPQNGCQLKSVFFFLKHRFHNLHFPNLIGLFTNPTGRHYTKYQFSPDIEVNTWKKEYPQIDLLKVLHCKSDSETWDANLENP